jgi:hypothetical protein
MADIRRSSGLTRIITAWLRSHTYPQPIPLLPAMVRNILDTPTNFNGAVSDESLPTLPTGGSLAIMLIAIIPMAILALFSVTRLITYLVKRMRKRADEEKRKSGIKVGGGSSMGVLTPQNNSR